MKTISRITVVLVAMALGLSALVFTQPAQASFKSTYGTSFWVNFDQNISDPSEAPGIFLAGPSSGTATITWPDGTEETVSLVAGGVASVDATAKIKTAGKYVTGSDIVGNFAVKIESSAAITVYVSNLRYASSDAAIAYPNDYLGTDYRVFTAPGKTGTERFSITATESGSTDVTITLRAGSTGTSPRTAGTPFTVSIDEGETYTLTGGQLAGTLISSTQKVAVSASFTCVAFGQGACDHVTEFMTPIETWGTSYILPSSRNSDHDDEFWVLAHEDNTDVVVDGGAATTLQAGQTLRITDASSNAVAINFRTLTSTKPVQVLQGIDNGSYAGFDENGPTTAGGDPAVVLLQPTAQFLNDAIISTPATGFDVNYVVIVAKTSDVTNGDVELNGAALSAGDFTAVTGTDFSVGRFDILPGAHRITSTNGFGAYVTGFGYFNSYAYAGGSGLVDLGQFPGGVAEVGYRTVEQIANNSSTGDVSRDVERTSWAGPVVERSTSPNNVPGGTAQFPGERHEQIQKVFLDGKEVTFKLVNGQIVIDVPRDQASGTYDLVVTGDFGTLRIQDALSIAGTATAELIGKKTWTSINAEKSAVRVIYKNPVNEGKVQFMLNGKEIAWARAVSDDDPKLRKYAVNGLEIPYLVRNVVLTPGIKNAFEIYVDGVRVWRAAYYSGN